MTINTYDKLITMLTLQAANLTTYKSEVGATAQDIDDVAQELAILEYLRDKSEIIDAGKKMMTKIKQTVFDGDKDEEIAPLPIFPVLSAPFPLTAGLLEKANRRNKRFKSAEGYTKQIGIALGIEEDAPQIVPETVKPTVTAIAAAEGYLMSVVVSGRGQSNMYEVQIRRKGQETWETVKTATGKSVDVTITPTTPGTPEKIQIRIRLIKNNEPYGQLSDAVSVTLNP